MLAAGTGKEGPGPLVSSLAKTAGTFPIPVAIVPGHLSDEDIDASLDARCRFRSQLTCSAARRPIYPV